MTTGEVVGGVLLTRDELLGVEELAVGASADLIDDRGLEVNEDSSRDVFAGRGFREERVEGVVGDAHRVVGGHLTIGVNPCP